MIRGMLISGAALDPAARAQEILSNNLANATTAGFRQDRLAFHQVLGGAGNAPAGRTGAGRLVAVSRAVDLAEGAIESTQNPLDLGIVGKGFFVVQGPAGDLFTRDGSLHLDAEGQILHRSGYPILTDGGPLIVSPRAQLSVDSTGIVYADGEAQGQLRLVELSNPQGLEHAGGNLIRSAEPGVPATAVRVVQGALEAANVNPVDTMIEMMALLRHYQANQNALTTQDSTLGQLIRWASS